MSHKVNFSSELCYKSKNLKLKKKYQSISALLYWYIFFFTKVKDLYTPTQLITWASCCAQP